jgi:CRP-like cAMP-binding protein
MPMPLTQEVLADVNGLSTVHVNRVLQHLRRDNLVKVGSGQVLLLDPDALASIGNYVPPVITRWV